MNEEKDNGLSPVEVLDEEGDVKLRGGSKTFLVSSKILALASPVFKQMLYDRRWREANTQQTVDQELVIPGLDDDTEPLEILLHVIHLSRKRVYTSLTPEQLLQVSKLADRYLCTATIDCQVRLWLVTLNMQKLKLSDVWKLCGVTYLVKNRTEFVRCLSILSRKANPTELKLVLIDLGLPYDTKPWLALIEQKRYSRMQKAILSIEETIKDLNSGKKEFDMDCQICSNCGKYLASSALSCKSCKSRTLREAICTPAIRLSYFLKELERCGITPLISQTSSSPLAFKKSLRFTPNDHKCEGGSECPLLEKCKALESSMKTLVSDEQSLDLESLNERFANEVQPSPSS